MPIANRHVIAGLSDGVIVLDREDRIVDLNPVAEQIIGNTMSTVFGKPVSAIIFPEHDLTPLLQSNGLDHIEIGHQKQLKLLHFDLRISSLINRHGELAGRALVIRDVSERKQLEQALVEAKNAAEAANQAKSEFLSVMGHELRTPLSVILLTCGILRRTEPDTLTEKQKSALEKIERNGEQLSTLIEDILEWGRFERNQLPILNITDIATDSIIHTEVERVMPIVERKELDLIVCSKDAPEIIRADEEKLHKIVGNLLDNAVKFTPRGGQIGLEIQANIDQSMARICVWDTGIGLTPIEIDNLFQPFTQLNDGLKRAYEGSGIGLALAKQFVDLHKGAIDVESRKGEGSRFAVSLPLRN